MLETEVEILSSSGQPWCGFAFVLQTGPSFLQGPPQEQFHLRELPPEGGPDQLVVGHQDLVVGSLHPSCHIWLDEALVEVVVDFVEMGLGLMEADVDD